VFVVEAFVPDLARFDRGQRVGARRVALDELNLEIMQHDASTQTVTSTQLVITERRTRLYPVKLRYAFPPEFDLMARLAGMRLRERFGGWHHEPYSAASVLHVSIYELNPASS